MTQTNDKQQAARVGLAFSGGDFVAASEPDIRDGQPVRRFRKDLISAGTYRHPGGQWTLDVTPERMDRWVAAFGRMRERFRGHLSLAPRSTRRRRSWPPDTSRRWQHRPLLSLRRAAEC
jgi:hypothetical protein